MKPLCIYHANCADGVTAAYVVRQATGAECIAAMYQEDPPWDLAKGRNIIMVDFSYKRPVMERLVPLAESFVWIDHHDTAIRDMADFDWPEGDVVVTDLERSGAGLAWDHYFPGQRRPLFVDLVEDRDLWRFKLERTRAFNMGLFSYPMSVETVERFFADPMALIARGEPILQYHNEQVRLAVGRAGWLSVGSFVVPVANVPPNLSSDVGNSLLKVFPKARLAATWFWSGENGKYIYSLRGADRDAHAGEVAKEYGGGGHPNAAGFSTTYELPLTSAPHWD